MQVFDTSLNKYVQHEHATPHISRVPGAINTIKGEVARHATDKKNPHQVTAEQVGMNKAQWNADRLKDTPIDDTHKGHGFGLGFNKETGHMEYFPYGDERFYDHNKLTNYEPLEHAKLDDTEISKKKIWSSAKTSKEVASKADTSQVLRGLESIGKQIATALESNLRGETGMDVIKIENHNHPDLEERLRLLGTNLEGHSHDEFKEFSEINKRISDVTERLGNSVSFLDEIDKKLEQTEEELELEIEAKDASTNTKFDSAVATLKAEVNTKADTKHSHQEYALLDDLKTISEDLTNKFSKQVLKVTQKPVKKVESVTIKDVQNLMTEKAELNHRHKIAQIVGLTEALAATSGLPDQTGNSGKYLTTNGSVASWATSAGTGTVTSVSGSGGTTGLTLTGGPITGSGTLTLGGTLAAANGGNPLDFDTNTPVGTPLNSVYRFRQSFNNFLPNSSFESWLSGTSVAPDLWVAAGGVTVSRNTTATIGTYSAQLVFNTANTGEFYSIVDVSTLVDYTFSAYVQRTSGTGAARLVAQQQDSPFTEFASVTLPTTAGWQLITLTVKPSAGTQMRFSIKSGNATASTWLIDEAMMQESKGVATGWLPSYLSDTYDQNVYGALTMWKGLTVTNGGLKTYDTGYDNTLALKSNENLTANRILNLILSDTDRTLTISGDATISGTNTGNETTTTAGALINGATGKTTPVDADYVGLMDSAASNILKKLSWANIKATLKTYFDTIYATAGASGITRTITTSIGSFTAGATAATDYVYLLAGAHVPTMPTAVGNTNRYTFKNNHIAGITFLTTSAQTIEGGTLTLNPNNSVDLISNNSNWYVI